MSFPAGTAAAAGLACCTLCGTLGPVGRARCPRCGHRLRLRTPRSIQRTLALTLTAGLLLVPANVLPIMVTVQLGRAEPSTILGGVVTLLHHGSWPIAAVIFVASVLVPLLKISTLLLLCASVLRRTAAGPRQRTLLYRATELVGRWSMIDVFVVFVLVALVHLGQLLVIRPGPAALAFAGAVILTMFAAEQFDPRLLWDHEEDARGGS